MTDCCAQPGLLPVVEARARLLASAVPVAETESVPLGAAPGRVLARAVTSRVDVPPADNSAMDGFAVRLADLVAGRALAVSQRIPAGSVPQPLAAGTAARIFTGAEIPPGADAVVMQEDCVYDEAQLRLRDGVQLEPGENIRPRGQDMRAGSEVLAAGTLLTPGHLGVAAAAGVAQLEVFRRLRVAIFSTGDELLEPGSPPAPGRIFNSNRYSLQGWLGALGCEVVDLGVVADTLPATRAALREAGGRADVVITTGGASVGEEDHLKPALAAEGEVGLWKIAIKPGKPLLFGRITSTGTPVPVVGLPGNPVSVAVTFMVLGAPFLRACQGRTAVLPRPLRLPAGFAARGGKREEYLRVRRVAGEGGDVLERYTNQSSGVLTSVAWADGLAVVPVDKSVAQRDPVDFFPWAELLSPTRTGGVAITGPACPEKGGASRDAREKGC